MVSDGGRGKASQSPYRAVVIGATGASAARWFASCSPRTRAIGKSPDDPGYLQVLHVAEETRQIVLAEMADKHLDAVVYATFDHQPAVIAADVMTRLVVDDVAGIGNNRRLSPILGFPAMTVPGGLTTDGLPVGLEFLARPFAEPTLFKFAYAYEQATHHRKPPASTPSLPGRP